MSPGMSAIGVRADSLCSTRVLWLVTQMYGPAVRSMRRWQAVLHQSIRPLIGASCSGRIMDISAPAFSLADRRNVTGTSFLGPQLVTKRLQLLSEVVPQHSRVAVLWHPHAYSDRTMDGMVKEAEHAAQNLGMQLQFVPANSPEEITGTFSTITRDSTDALCVFSSPNLRPLKLERRRARNGVVGNEITSSGQR